MLFIIFYRENNYAHLSFSTKYELAGMIKRHAQAEVYSHPK